jgi:hypothetical protein
MEPSRVASAIGRMRRLRPPRLRLVAALTLLAAFAHSDSAWAMSARDASVRVVARGVTGAHNDPTVWRGRTAVVVSRRLRAGVSLELCTTAGCKRLGRSSRDINDVRVATAGSRPVVVWTQPGDSGSTVDLMLWDGERRRIFAGNRRTAPIIFVTVAANGRGDAAIAWRSEGRILLVRRDHSGRVGQPEALAEGEVDGSPTIAVSPSGDILAAWDTSVGFDTRYARPGEPFAPTQTTAQRLEVHAGPTKYKNPGRPIALVHHLEATFVGAHQAIVVAHVAEVPAHEGDCADEGSIEAATVTPSGAPQTTTFLSGEYQAGSFSLGEVGDRPWVVWIENEWVEGECEEAQRLHWRRWREGGFSRERSCRLPRHLRASLEMPMAIARPRQRAWVFLGALRDLGVTRRAVIDGNSCRFGMRRFEMFGVRSAGGRVDYLGTRSSGRRGFDVVVLK